MNSLASAVMAGASYNAGKSSNSNNTSGNDAPVTFKRSTIGSSLVRPCCASRGVLCVVCVATIGLMSAFSRMCCEQAAMPQMTRRRN